jgi:hypothetical protein
LNKLIYILILVFVFASCGNETTDKTKVSDKTLLSDTLLKPSHIDENQALIISPENKQTQQQEISNNGITLKPIDNTIKTKVTLKLQSKNFIEGENQLTFSVSGIENYHLFVFLNGALFKANQNTLNIDLLDGNNLLACFLTDENYVIIKQASAIILKNIILGNHDDYFNEKQPHFLYFSPNNYSNNLDFLLINTNLENHNFKVKTTIDGNEFYLNKWLAYKISGLKKGEHSVRLQLVDENNHFIEGPFNDSGVNLFRIN